MTFRDYMIQKLETLYPPPMKKETKCTVTFFLPRHYSDGYFEITIPKPGTRNYRNVMSQAMSHFATYFNVFGRSSTRNLALQFLEFEELEAKTREENQ